LNEQGVFIFLPSLVFGVYFSVLTLQRSGILTFQRFSILTFQRFSILTFQRFNILAFQHFIVSTPPGPNFRDRGNLDQGKNCCRMK